MSRLGKEKELSGRGNGRKVPAGEGLGESEVDSLPDIGRFIALTTGL